MRQTRANRAIDASVVAERLHAQRDLNPNEYGLAWESSLAGREHE